MKKQSIIAIAVIVLGVSVILQQYKEVANSRKTFPSTITWTDQNRVIIEGNRIKVDVPAGYDELGQHIFVDNNYCLDGIEADLNIITCCPKIGYVMLIKGQSYSGGGTCVITRSMDQSAAAGINRTYANRTPTSCETPHEIVHAVMSCLDMPSWAHEGIATYEETNPRVVPHPLFYSGFRECLETGFLIGGSVADENGVYNDTLVPYASFRNNSEFFNLNRDVTYKTGNCFWRRLENRTGHANYQNIFKKFPAISYEQYQTVLPSRPISSSRGFVAWLRSESLITEQDLQPFDLMFPTDSCYADIQCQTNSTCQEGICIETQQPPPPPPPPPCSPTSGQCQNWSAWSPCVDEQTSRQCDCPPITEATSCKSSKNIGIIGIIIFVFIASIIIRRVMTRKR